MSGCSPAKQPRCGSLKNFDNPQVLRVIMCCAFKRSMSDIRTISYEPSQRRCGNVDSEVASYYTHALKRVHGSFLVLLSETDAVITLSAVAALTPLQIARSCSCYGLLVPCSLRVCRDTLCGSAARLPNPVIDLVSRRAVSSNPRLSVAHFAHDVCVRATLVAGGYPVCAVT